MSSLPNVDQILRYKRKVYKGTDPIRTGFEFTLAQDPVPS